MAKTPEERKARKASWLVPGADTSIPQWASSEAEPSVAPAAAPAAAPSHRDPAAILAGEAASAPAVPAAPGGSYYVQAGAFAGLEEAEQQRAKLAMLGLEGRITERDQGGRTVYRVRVGPMDRAQADEARSKLGAAGVESALIAASR